MTDHSRQDVRDFYDRIGWSLQDDGLYQNARYEDLRPVAAEYIHRCHLRLKSYLAPSGDYLLDAGSGPVQYPEYLTYSQDYRYRVCADLSITALKEARKRLGDKGLFVVCDITRLPFKSDAFDGIVSLHAIHHVDVDKQPATYAELYRTLKPGRSAAIVNAWKKPALMEKLGFLIRLSDYLKSAPGALKRR
ncbi:MAG: class I SAM-dependent methyltransferase, partial [Anaerolineales bacterium]